MKREMLVIVFTVVSSTVATVLMVLSNSPLEKAKVLEGSF